MKLPAGLLDVNGGAAKGTVHLSSARNANRDSHLQEFGLTIDGTTATCYALTAPGDVIDVDFAFNPYVADFVDLIVDGVRRRTLVTRASKVIFRTSFDRGLYLARLNDGKRGGLKNCRFQIKSQDHLEDIEIDNQMVPSSVGSIMLQLFQKKSVTSGDDDNEPVERYPDYEQCADWMETPNHNVFHSDDIPSLEIDLVEPTKGTKQMREQSRKLYSGEYKLLTTVVFLLRTTDELRKMERFANVPDYTAPDGIPPPLSGRGRPKSKSKSKTLQSTDFSNGDIVEYEDDVVAEETAVNEDVGNLSTEKNKVDQRIASSAGSATGSITSADVLPVSVQNDVTTRDRLTEPFSEYQEVESFEPCRMMRSNSDLSEGLFINDHNQLSAGVRNPVTPTKTRDTAVLLGSPMAPATLASLMQARAQCIDGKYIKEESLEEENIHPMCDTKSLEGGLSLDQSIFDEFPVQKFENDIEMTDVITNTTMNNQTDHRCMLDVKSPISDTSTELAPLEDILAATNNSGRPVSNDTSNSTCAIDASEFDPASNAMYSQGSTNKLGNHGVGDIEQLPTTKDRLNNDTTTEDHESMSPAARASIEIDDLPKVPQAGEKTRSLVNSTSVLEAHGVNPASILVEGSRSEAGIISKRRSKSVCFSPRPELITAATSTKATAQKTGTTAAQGAKREAKAANATKAAAKTTDSKKSATAATSTKNTAVKRKATAESAKPGKKRKTTGTNETKSVADIPLPTLSPSKEKAAVQMQAAQERKDAAEERKKQLTAEFEAALLFKNELAEAKKVNKQAEEIERQNEELQAKIDALFAAEM